MDNTHYFTIDLNTDNKYIDLCPPELQNRQGFPFKMLLSLHRAGHMPISFKDKTKDREEYFKAVNAPVGQVIGLTQKHTKRIIMADQMDPTFYENIEADGFLCRGETPILSVTVADCLPVFLWNSDYSVFGLLHSGWQGTGIVIEALEMIKAVYCIEPEAMHVVIGPGIGECCYAVSRERYKHFGSQFGAEAVSEHDGQYYLNLRMANRLLMEKTGIASLSIAENCTCCSPELGSYRRDGREGFHNMIALFGRF